MIRFIVQAYCTGEGWMDCRKAASREEAEGLEADLLTNDDAWMPAHQGPVGLVRRTRIVPVEESRRWPAYRQQSLL